MDNHGSCDALLNGKSQTNCDGMLTWANTGNPFEYQPFMNSDNVTIQMLLKSTDENPKPRVKMNVDSDSKKRTLVAVGATSRAAPVLCQEKIGLFSLLQTVCILILYTLEINFNDVMYAYT